MILPQTLKKTWLSKAVALVLCVLVASSILVGSVSATTFSWSLNNWELNSTWHGKAVNGTGVYTLQVSYGGVHLTNATFDGKFCFSLATDDNTGYSVEVYAGAGSRLGLLSADNTVFFKKLVTGAETLLYTGIVSSSSFKIAYDNASLVQFYINGVKVYQDNAQVYAGTQLQYFTTEVPLAIGDITQPSCFTGSFGVSMVASGSVTSSGSGSIDTSQMTDIFNTLIVLMVALLPLMIYMAVFKMIPKLLKGINL